MIAPAARLLAAVAAWTAAALLALLLPSLWPLLLAAGALLLVLVVWDALLLGAAAAPSCTRILPARAFVGRADEVTLRVENPGNAPVQCDVFDEAPAALRRALESTDGDVELEPRFRQVQVASRAALELRYPVCAAQRGDHAFGPCIILQRSPLGWLQRRRSMSSPETLRVYPDASRFLRSDALRPRRVLRSMGVQPQRRRGEGMEFESLRDYLPGDDPRRVDWKATARRGRVVVRQYQHEANHTLIIAVDASRLMASDVDGRSKLDHAIDAALALAYAALAAGDRVGLVVFDREVVAYQAPLAHRGHFGALLELLRPIQTRLVEANHHALLRWLNAHHRRRALVVVLTDFVEAGARSFREPLTLLGQRHRVVLVAVRDRVFRLLDAAAHSGDALDVYRRIVLDDLLRQRETALTVLRRRGAQTLDLAPELITGAVLNQYLALRYGPER